MTARAWDRSPQVALGLQAAAVGSLVAGMVTVFVVAGTEPTHGGHVGKSVVITGSLVLAIVGLVVSFRSDGSSRVGRALTLLGGGVLVALAIMVGLAITSADEDSSANIGAGLIFLVGLVAYLLLAFAHWLSASRLPG